MINFPIRLIGRWIVFIIITGYLFSSFLGVAVAGISLLLVLDLIVRRISHRESIPSSIPWPYFFSIVLAPFIAIVAFKTPWGYPQGTGVDGIENYYIAKMIDPSFSHPGGVFFAAYAPGFHVLADYFSQVLHIPLIQMIFLTPVVILGGSSLILFVIMDWAFPGNQAACGGLSLAWLFSYQNIDALCFRGFYPQILGTFLLLFLLLNVIDYRERPKTYHAVTGFLILIALAVSYPAWLPCAAIVWLLVLIGLRKTQEIMLGLLAAGAGFILVSHTPAGQLYWHSIKWNIVRSGDCIHPGLFSFEGSFFKPGIIFQVSILAVYLLGTVGLLRACKNKKGWPLLYGTLAISTQVAIFWMLHQKAMVSGYYIEKTLYLLPCVLYPGLLSLVTSSNLSRLKHLLFTGLILLPVLYMSGIVLIKNMSNRSLITPDDISAVSDFRLAHPKEVVLYITDSKLHAVWLQLMGDPQPSKKFYSDYDSSYLLFFKQVPYINLQREEKIANFLAHAPHGSFVYVQDFDALPTAVKRYLDIQGHFGAVAIGRVVNPDENELRREIGQMIMVGFRGSVLDEQAPILQQISDLNLGGVILFDENASHHEGNIKSPQQLKTLISTLQAHAAVPLLIAVDAEGGAINRLKPEQGFMAIPTNRQLGQQNDLNQTRQVSEGLAQELANLGINVNLSPVVDLDINPRNPAIGLWGRSYGKDPTVVTQEAETFIDGQHAKGIITTIKHFPGQGSAVKDTHEQAVDVTDTYQAQEIIPYQNLISFHKADMVMTSHILNRAVDPLYPATLSKAFIEDLLRRRLGFQGVVMTDDMQMSAITKHYSLTDAIILAINAGDDILLFANNGKEYNDKIAYQVRDDIWQAFEEGKIPVSRIEEAGKRIRELKNKWIIHGQ